MNKSTLFGLFLILLVLFGFSAYNTSKMQKARERAAAEAAEKAAQDSSTIVMATDTLAKENQENNNFFPAANADSLATQTPMNDFVVETNLARYTFSPRGGFIKKLEFKDIYAYAPKDSVKPNLILVDDNSQTINIALQLKNQSMLFSKDLLFSVVGADTLIVADNDPTEFALRAYPTTTAQTEASEQITSADSNSYIEYLYTFTPDDFRFGFKIRFVNMSKYLYPNRSYTLEWFANLYNVEQNYEYERDNTTVFYMDNTEDVDNLEERKSDKKEFSSELKWISFKQQFFTSTLIAEDVCFQSGNLQVTVPEKSERHLLKTDVAELEFNVENQDNGTFDMSLYYGPNQYKLLKQYDLRLERQVPLGWSFLLHWINRICIIPIFNWLEAYGISYGIIILILTIIIKTILLPVAYKTYISSAKMRALKPEIMEINARYPKTDDAMKKQQATMSLYKRAGVSPMAGCLPMLIQFPILVAMFRFFPSAYELRQQAFLWADDLSTYDSIYNFGFNVPFYGDHVSLFTLLMTIATLVYTWLNNKLMSPAGGDENQQKMMKWMMYLMPILFLGMFNSFSSALTYYYLLVNLITFAQMGIFRIVIKEDKLRAKLLHNMSKPVKKSKWEKRLEEMQKRQQAMMQQQQKRK